MNAAALVAQRQVTVEDIIETVPLELIPRVLARLAAIQGGLVARLMAAPLPAAVGAAPEQPQAADDSAGRLLTARELAGILALAPARIYELARIGRIPAKRIGERQLRFDVAEVRRALGR